MGCGPSSEYQGDANVDELVEILAEKRRIQALKKAKMDNLTQQNVNAYTVGQQQPQQQESAGVAENASSGEAERQMRTQQWVHQNPITPITRREAREKRLLLAKQTIKEDTETESSSSEDSSSDSETESESEHEKHEFETGEKNQLGQTGQTINLTIHLDGNQKDVNVNLPPVEVQRELDQPPARSEKSVCTNTDTVASLTQTRIEIVPTNDTATQMDEGSPRVNPERKKKKKKEKKKKTKQQKDVEIEEDPVQLTTTFSQTETWIAELRKRMSRLHQVEDFCLTSPFEDLMWVSKVIYTSSREELRIEIVKKVYELGIIDIIIKLWDSVTSNGFVASENYVGLKNLKRAVSIMWNSSDLSRDFCQTLVDRSIVQRLFLGLMHPRMDITSVKSDSKVFIAKGSLSILHNIIRQCDVRDTYRGVRAVEILMKCRKSENPGVKNRTEILLCYLMNQDENAIINSDDRNVALLIKILASSLKSSNHFTRKYGFCAAEVTEALDHLAVHDSNKEKIVRNNGLTYYAKMLREDCSTEEQLLAARGLWTLAFNKECRRHINEEPGIVEALKYHEKHGSRDAVRRACRGALWVILERDAHKGKNVNFGDKYEVPHVMISYQWDCRNVMVRVKDRLKAAGYKVWMDVEKQSSTLESSMTHGIEDAAACIVCVSQKYKESPSCRAEAEYMHKLRKHIIPVRVQHHHNPDGWLGDMVGTNIRIDLSSDDLVEHNMRELVRDVGESGKYPSGYRQDGNLANGNALISTPKKLGVPGWTSYEVKKWLKDNEMAHLTNRFNEYNGEMLLHMKAMSQQSPDFYYQSLVKDMGFCQTDILKFTTTLHKIPT